MINKLMKILTILYVFNHTLFAYDCSRINEFQKNQFKGDTKLQYMANCSWLIDATAYYIHFSTTYEGDLYFGLEDEKKK